MTATLLNPLALQLQHHLPSSSSGSRSGETLKGSFQYIPARLEGKATQGISQLSYTRGVFMSFPFFTQH